MIYREEPPFSVFYNYRVSVYPMSELVPVCLKTTGNRPPCAL